MLHLVSPQPSVYEPTLIAEPLALRPGRLRDHRAWAALRQRSRRHLIAWEDDWIDEELSLAHFRRRLRLADRRARAGAALTLFIFRRVDMAMVGGLSIANIRFGAARSGVLGYWIGAEHTRRGYGRLAVETALDHAFEALGLHRIEAAVQPENEASRRLVRKCGFVREGRARDYLRINGEWRDHDIYAVTALDRARRGER